MKREIHSSSLGLTVFLICIMLLIGNIVMADGLEDEGQIDVLANLESNIKVKVVKSPLEFNIKDPDTGVYRESNGKHAQVNVKFNCPVRIEFDASDLTYQRKGNSGEFPLNVTYWVDNESNSFTPDKNYVISKLDYEHNVVKQFKLYGQIELESLASQPAGEYKGTITITVSEVE